MFQGFVCDAVVMNLYPRRGVGCFLQLSKTTDLVADLAHGYMAKKTERETYDSLPLRQPVHQHALDVLSECTDLQCAGEPRSDFHYCTAAGGLFQASEALADQASNTMGLLQSKAKCVRLGQSVLKLDSHARASECCSWSSSTAGKLRHERKKKCKLIRFFLERTRLSS